LSEQLVSRHETAGILRDGKIRMATLRTLAGNDALSWSAKLHMLPLFLKTLTCWPNLDQHAFWKAHKYDNRSVAEMFPGADTELLEYLLQPMLNGYFYWTPERVSEAMLLILNKAALTQGRSYKMRDGLYQIPKALAGGSTVLLSHAVKTVRRQKNGTYTVTVEHGGRAKTLRADGIVCATTASAVPGIMPDLNHRQKAFFDSVEYSSTVVVARTFKREQTRGHKGIAFPRKEGIELSAITIAPELGGSGSLATLKTYASGTIGKQLCAKPDNTVVRALLKAMEPAREEVLVGNPKPVATHIQRWPEALPYFDVGHFKRLHDFEAGAIEGQNDAIVFAGDYLGGPFMEGAFTSGMNAADRLHTRLLRQSKS
jgi:oxygen-dependent protoporphyrinogen oxidase